MNEGGRVAPRDVRGLPANALLLSRVQARGLEGDAQAECEALQQQQEKPAAASTGASS